MQCPKRHFVLQFLCTFQMHLCHVPPQCPVLVTMNLSLTCSFTFISCIFSIQTLNPSIKSCTSSTQVFGTDLNYHFFCITPNKLEVSLRSGAVGVFVFCVFLFLFFFSIINICLTCNRNSIHVS